MALSAAEVQRRYRHRHPDRVRARKRKYRATSESPKRCDLKYRTTPSGSFVSKRADARVRGLEFTLSREHHDDLVTDVCYWCGAPPEPLNGIDRMDNSRGYVEDNVVSCCATCNWAKRKQTPDQFRAWINRAHAWINR